jgi:hypothetical protein
MSLSSPPLRGEEPFRATTPNPTLTRFPEPGLMLARVTLLSSSDMPRLPSHRVGGLSLPKLL